MVIPLFSIEATAPAVGKDAGGPVTVFFLFFIFSPTKMGSFPSLEALAGEVTLEMFSSPHPQILSSHYPWTTLSAPLVDLLGAVPIRGKLKDRLHLGP